MGCEEDKLHEMKKMSLQERSLKYWEQREKEPPPQTWKRIKRGTRSFFEGLPFFVFELNGIFYKNYKGRVWYFFQKYPIEGVLYYLFNMEEKENCFPVWLKNPVQILNKYSLLYIVSFFVFHISMHASYNVIEFDSHRENCIISSVYYVYMIRTVKYSSYAGIFGLAGVFFMWLFNISIKSQRILFYMSILCCLGAWFCNLTATINMLDFIGQSSQPAIAAMHGPLAGYHCPK